jgi:hypothetical protein
MRPRYAGRFIRDGSHVAHADDAVQGDSSPTGHTVMYGDDSIRIELARGANERAA